MDIHMNQRLRVSHNYLALDRCAGRYGCYDGPIQLSSQAHMMMRTARLMNALTTGPLGLITGGLTGNGRAGGTLRTRQPEFGTVRSAIDGKNASPAAPGQARELKSGETVRGANGSLVKWSKDGNLDITYKDRNGRNKNINVKNGMIRIDGGRPRKLENTGQLLKLPNGDVVGLGNNPQAKGQKLCRVVMADGVNQIKTEPASATNVYDIGEMERKQTRTEGGGISLNYSQTAECTPWGMQSYASANLSVFLGHPVTRRWTETVMDLTGVK